MLSEFERELITTYRALRTPVRQVVAPAPIPIAPIAIASQDVEVLRRDLFAACERIADVEKRIRTLEETNPYKGPWLTSRAAAAYVGSKSMGAYYEWRRRHGIVPRDNGTVARADLDRELAPTRRRHDAAVRAGTLRNLKRK